MTNTDPNIIAIDGPAASGKSTLAIHLANGLNYLYFDTGIMYRAVTLAGLKAGMDLSDEAAVTDLSERIKIDVKPPTPGVVMVGRDIGTVVFPEADLKLYLVASVEERARRRYQELVDNGGHPNYEEIAASMRRRDEIDSHRAIAPLKPADDARIIDTDHLTIEQVYVKVKEMMR
jgi:cytidylate kinase